MKNIIAGAAVTLLLWSTVPRAQNPPADDTDNLNDLASLTLSCPKVALNAAAREAAKVRTQGAYQFAYFKILNDSHHAMYEVHFATNYAGEKDLKYCVAVYCQQGWDPAAKTTVTLLDAEHKSCKH